MATIPVLLITSTGATNPFGNYYTEILRNEGFNSFQVSDISSVTASTLSSYNIVILAEMTLTSSQVTMLITWVNGGGRLIAMRPDPQINGLLGITGPSGTLDNAYLLVNTASSPGKGIVGQTIQYKGTANRYTLNGATSVATLYSDASTATTNPAVTIRTAGIGTGRVAAFAYDLARSIVYMRQGNPAWVGQERDNILPQRSDDLFYPDWVDMNKVSIPQADEQQRLLANIIIELTKDTVPLPRFWYLPRGLKAAVVMTGDDHAGQYNGITNATEGRFDQYISLSPQNCSLDNWECIRSTSYMYRASAMTDAQALAYQNMGFEMSPHIYVDTAYGGCGTNPDQAQQEGFYTDQLNLWKSKYTGLRNPRTHRTHCVAWSGWTIQPTVELNHGIRFDTNYYYFPSAWVQDRPGFFTGSGMPMRFCDLNGNIIDVYQAVTQMTDESGQTYPFTCNSLFDKAIGPEQYFGVFTVNAHTDSNPNAVSDAVVSSALARGIPIVSADQMLDWIDGRNNSTYSNVVWTGTILSFSVTAASGSNGLQVMVPAKLNTKTVNDVKINGIAATNFSTQTIKGISYAFVGAPAGVSTFEITYADWYPGDMHVHRSCRLPPISIADMYLKMVPQNLNFMSLLADMGNGEVLDPVTDLPRVTGSDDPISVNGRILHWDAEWHWDPAGVTYPQKALGGHIAALGLTEAHQIYQEYTYPILDWAHQQNGIAGFVHMQYLDNNIPQSLTCCTPIEYPVEVALGTVDFISEDVVTGSDSVPDMCPDCAIQAYYRLLNCGFRPSFTAGTDYPCTTTTTANPGDLLTYVKVAGGTVTYSSWIDGIKKGRTVVSRNGHNEFLDLTLGINNAGPGDEIKLTGTGSVTATVTWTGTSPLGGTIELVKNSTVVASAPVGSGLTVSLTATVTFSKSGWLAARRMTSNGHQSHTGAVFVTVDNKPVRASAGDAQFYIQWMDNLLTKTSAGGIWNQYFTNSLSQAQARYRAAKAVFQQILLEAEQVCPCSIWSPTTTPSVITTQDSAAIELGVKFRSDVNGYITGIRFYKGPTNTGTHIGSLWSSTGTLLGRVTFTNETATGWQQMLFSAPVQISANTTYIASYHTNAIYYSSDTGYFAGSGIDNPPLHALQDGVDGGNGVYAYSSTPAFPTDTFQSSNYWVDVIFETVIACQPLTTTMVFLN